MILSKGKLYDSKEQDIILKNLENDINITRMEKTLSVHKVINAIDKLGQAIDNGEFENEISQLNIEGIEKYIETAAMSLKRDSIEYKVKIELGEYSFEIQKTNPPFKQKGLTIRHMPLGTLLHIAAGNVDGLPAFSVAEGILTGNINILKLPQVDNGLSIKIIMKLIEWGHKLGFAYISGYEDKNADLTALAEHILSTKQLLCSSCQTIFIDTDSIDELHVFCKEFLPFLEDAALKYPFDSIGSVAERTLRNYNKKLEDILSSEINCSKMVHQGDHCSLTVCDNKSLELSDMFGNCLVKGLPQNELFTVLRETKGYLQTAGLICKPEKRAELTDLLARSGLTRIM